MRVTVCEIGNNPKQLLGDWENLIAHTRAECTDMLLLPEMPFYPWPAWTRAVDRTVWEESVAAHKSWIQRLEELSATVVFGTRPVIRGRRAHNEGFVWDRQGGSRPVHTKYYLPDEEGFWEASWYERGSGDFDPVQIGDVVVGFMICTELWFMAHAREYALSGVNLLVCPRATPASSRDKWLAGGRVAAVVSGAYCLSSCFGGTDRNGMQWAGNGWIIEPEEGGVLAFTSASEPFVTRDIDLDRAGKAKQTYPRYVKG
jgi:N-carbamoylputrescine amidase